jgi:D-sedoheptulose 7-phosphate isomerase
MTKILNKLVKKFPNLIYCKKEIIKGFNLLKESYKNKNKVLICGNGGSASDSDHISGELLKGFEKKRLINKKDGRRLNKEIIKNLQNGLPAIPLPNFTGLISAFNNDCNPKYVYAQMVWVLGKKGDTLICISTSGNSKNIIQAAKVAESKGINVVSLTGQSGGKLKSSSDVTIKVPENLTRKIQEYHLPIYHTLCLMLENYFF